MINNRNLFWIGLLCTSLLYYHCNTVPDSVTITDDSFKPVENNLYVKDDTLFLFSGNIGTKLSFTGSKSCTTLVNGTVESTALHQPFYRTITTADKGILDADDSTYGLMEFTVDDINFLKIFLVDIRDSNSFVGARVKEKMGNDRFNIIAAYTDQKQLTVKDKQDIIAAINVYLADSTFYMNYKPAIYSLLAFSDLFDTLKADVNMMVQNNYFLDTSGSVDPGVSQMQKNEIHWFNWRIFAKYFNVDGDGTNKTVFYEYPASGRLFKVSFKEGADTSAMSEVIRYFEINNKQISQVAFKNKFGLYTEKSAQFDTKVHDYIFATTSHWKITPFFTMEELPFLGGVELTQNDVKGRATMQYQGYSSFKDTVFYSLNCYYAINKTIQAGDSYTVVNGAVSMKVSYGKTSTTDDRGQILSWNTDVYLKASNLTRDRIVEYKEYKKFSRDN